MAVHPVVLLAAVAGPSLGVLFLYLAFERPRVALQAGLVLLLLAETDYRNRDPMASVAGVVDAQVLFELGVYLLLGAATVAVLLTDAVQRRRLGTIEKLLIGFVGFAIMSSVWSETSRLSFVRGIQLGVLLAVVLTAVRVFDPSEAVRASARALVAYVLVFGFMAAVFPWAARGAGGLGAERFSWFSTHPVVPATYSSLGAILLIGEALFSARGWGARHFGVPVALLILPLLAVLVLAQSRAPLFAFLAVSGFLFSIRYLGVWALPLTLLFLPVVGFLVGRLDAPVTGTLATLSNQEAWYADLLLRGQSPEEFLSLTGRLGLWQDAGGVFLAQPLGGYGYQGSRAALLAIRSWAGYAHNAFLQTLLDLGLIGTLLFWPIFLIYLVRETVVSAVPDRLEDRRWWHTSLFAAAGFLFIHGLANAGFAGPPTFQTLIVFAALVMGSRAFWAASSDAATSAATA